MVMVGFMVVELSFGHRDGMGVGEMFGNQPDRDELSATGGRNRKSRRYHLKLAAQEVSALGERFVLLTAVRE